MAQHDKPVPRGRLRRTMPLAGFAARATGGRLVAGLRERTGDDGAVERFHERTAERYTELLGHSKGVLMKAGQILSMIDARALGTGGFYPYQKALARLQAQAPPMHPLLVRQVLDEELGSAVRHFAEFCDESMAAASVGQVHRAVLRDRREVVVKIQYPGVAQAIRDDLANTELLATFLRFAVAASGMTIDIRALAREAAARIGEEIDYQHEAAMIITFGDLYRGHPFIGIPQVIPEASTDRVLTMTYLDGMDYAAAQQADQDLKNTWAEVIGRFINGNYRHANLIHADAHPGNYRFNTDGSVGFLDFGCIQHFPEKQRWPWVAAIRALVEDRPNDHRDLMVQAGFLTADSPLSADELQRRAINMARAASHASTGHLHTRHRGVVDQRNARCSLGAPADLAPRVPLPRPGPARLDQCGRRLRGNTARACHLGRPGRCRRTHHRAGQAAPRLGARARSPRCTGPP